MHNNKTAIHSEQAPCTIGPYSQAIRVGDTIYLSGQIPLLPATMELNVGSIELQTEQVFENLRAVCAEAGGGLGDIVKLTIYLTNLDYFTRVNEVMARFFQQPYPARAAIGVAELPKGAEIAVEAIMVAPTIVDRRRYS